MMHRTKTNKKPFTLGGPRNPPHRTNSTYVQRVSDPHKALWYSVLEFAINEAELLKRTQKFGMSGPAREWLNSHEWVWITDLLDIEESDFSRYLSTFSWYNRETNNDNTVKLPRAKTP